MAQGIVEHYGKEESIAVINEAMDRIATREQAIQDLLWPFVNKDDKEAQGKLGERELDLAGLFEYSSTFPGEKNSARKSISDLKSSGELPDTQAIVGEVVHKSNLRPYLSKDRHRRRLFYLVIADETASIKVLVYGKKRYGEIAEKKSYLFRRLLIHGNCLKVPALAKVSETSAVEVPEKIEAEAQNLLFSETEVCSIAEIRASDERRDVSVQGTVEETRNRIRTDRRFAEDELGSKMSDLENKWKKNLSSILEELDSQQYKKTLLLLDKIPKSFRGGKAKENIAQKIIEHYGAKESIIEMRRIMDAIPRRDHAVQVLLKPFKKINDQPPKKKKAPQQSSTSGGGGPQSSTSGGGGPQSSTSGEGGPQSSTSGGGGPQSSTSGGGGPQSSTSGRRTPEQHIWEEDPRAAHLGEEDPRAAHLGRRTPEQHIWGRRTPEQHIWGGSDWQD
ncbi:hypothetical protein Q5P01_018989 [Channa striata]|uniref:Pyrin domain-containing protein n=1 Tax=Channa striata TaxID=64152 RepID=A0AA88M078_CHASR|nr:hypothetical protein Q5P01_018989 [Channa striata]